MRKNSKVDFFTVEIESDSDLESILKTLHALPANSEKRNEEINDDWIRLARGKVSDEGYLGDMMRISMAPAGFRANLAGDIIPLDLKQDEGMAECSAFYYDFETAILVLQRNSRAVSSTQLSRYFKRVGNVDGEVVIKPIIRPTDLMKVKTLPVVKKLHIASTVVDAMTTMDELDSNTRQAILTAAQTEAPGLEILLKSGRDKGATLNEAIVVEMIESWLKIHADLSDEENEIVKKITVTGKDESGATAEFDLLRDRIFTIMTFDQVPNDQEMWNTRSKEIEKAWDLNKKNLLKTVEATRGAE